MNPSNQNPYSPKQHFFNSLRQAVKLTYIGAVILTLFLSGCGSSSSDQASFSGSLAPGFLDQSFGSFGSIIINPKQSPYYDQEYSGYNVHQVLALENKKILILAEQVTPLGKTSVALIRLNEDGSFDSTFGENRNGQVMLEVILPEPPGGIIVPPPAMGEEPPPPPPEITEGVSLQVDSDGKIIIAGQAIGKEKDSFEHYLYNIYLAKFNSDGHLDETFGTGGLATLNITLADETGGEPSSDYIKSMSIQPDGKILLAGYTEFYMDSETKKGSGFLVRYGANGSIDPSFGPDGNGQVEIKFPVSTTNTVNSIHFDVVKNKFLIGGDFKWSQDLTDSDGNPYSVIGSRYYLRRINLDGSTDTSFGPDGNGTYASPLIENHMRYLHSLAVGADDKIALNITSSGYYRIMQHLGEGNLDPNFGSDGRFTFPAEINAVINDLKVQADGKVLSVGYASSPYGSIGSSSLFLARVTPQGKLDTSFGYDPSLSLGYSGMIFDLSSFRSTFGHSIQIINDQDVLVLGEGGRALNSSSKSILIQKRNL